MNKDHSFVFEIYPSTAFRLFCWLWGLLHFFWGIPAHSSIYNVHMSKIHPFQSILIYWFLKCQCSLLPSPIWPLPIALIHGPNIPGSYAILLFTASDFTSITSYIHNWVLFLLWLHPFILSGVISPLISSSISGNYWPGEFIFQYHIFLASHTVHGILKARISKWLTIPFSSGHVLS